MLVFEKRAQKHDLILSNCEGKERPARGKTLAAAFVIPIFTTRTVSIQVNFLFFAIFHQFP